MRAYKTLAFIFIFSLLIGPQLARAQDAPPKPPAPKPDDAGVKPIQQPGKAVSLKITGAKGTLRHGQAIVVEFVGLENYRQKHTDLTKYVLYVDGIKVVEGAKLIKKNKLRFDFEPGKVAKETWGRLSNCIFSKDSFYTPAMRISLGYGNEPLILSETTYTLDYIGKQSFWWSLAVYFALLITFFILAYNTAIIRDPGPPITKEFKPPYSLGKSQMAFWFFIVVPCFFFIWIITGSTESLTGSTLILLSISTMTTLLSGFVGKAKDDKLLTERDALQTKLEGVRTQMRAAPADTILQKSEQEVADRLKQIDEEIKERDDDKSRGFVPDILRDTHGINLHRFQCAIWTLVLGGIFIKTTVCTLAMPDFSGTLLTLLGISNGTYVALKVPEK